MSMFDQLFVLGSFAVVFTTWAIILGIVSFLTLLTPKNIKRFSRGIFRIIRYGILRSAGIGSKSAFELILHK
ncbi:hypothetical protein [Weissella oryzae]|nr:hypothetical protein [Weissella oryzae]